jgi:hypothetical protein
MRPVQRHLFCTLLATGAFLLPASPALADIFHVDDEASSAGDCSAVTPCQTIGAAVSAARGTAAADTIQVAAGLYEEPLELIDEEDTGLTINGAGSGADPDTATIIRSGGPAVYFVIVLGDGFTGGEDHMTVRDLRVEHTSFYDSENDQYRGAGIGVNASDSLLENVHVELPAPGGHPISVGDPAVSVRAPRVTIDHLVARNPGGGQGLSADSDDLVVRDSDIQGGDGGGIGVGGDGDLRLLRSRVAASPLAEHALRTEGTLTADSSLLTGGRVGLLYFGTTGPDPVNAVLRGLTIDTGTPGIADPQVLGETAGYGGIGIQLQGGGADLDSSIVLERSIVSGGELRCRFSDVPHQVEGPSPDNNDGSIACPSAPGNAQGNTSSAPASLFAGAPGGDWTLRANAPALDRGTPSALAAGESATDLAGAARVLDSNRDCLARRDQGAYELTGAQNTPPVIGAIGPLETVVGTPFIPVAQIGDAEDPPEALTYVWRFADGAVSGAPPVSHTFNAPIDAGRLDITVTDSGGCTTSAGRGFRVLPGPALVPIDLSAPRFTSFSLTRRTFAVGERPTAVAAKKARQGTVVRWSLSKRALVEITVERLVRKRGRLRAVRVGTLRRVGPRGRYRLAFSGRIGKKALKPGRYRLRAIATDGYRNVSKEKRASFTVVSR